MTTHRKASTPVYLKAVAGETGVFDAIVSVFGNVDLANERIQPGAFSKTLDAWASSGDPIPVIFSHRWDDLNAHVGIVRSAEELAPGDPRLPAELAANGGLLTRLALDVDDPGAPFAARLSTLMSRRSIREFSFAFDVPEGGSRLASDGVVDLTELDLFEVGPCLRGMNPETALLGRKQRDAVKTALAAGVDIDQALIEAELDALEAGLAKSVTTVGGWIQASPGIIEDGKAQRAAELKVWARPDGSIEQHLDAVQAAATTWALDRYGDNLYALHLDGTFPDDSRTVVIAERWEDPLGEGPLWELNYAPDPENPGALMIGAAREVSPVLTVTPKARKSAALARSRATVRAVEAKDEGATKEPHGAAVKDLIPRSEDETRTDGMTPLGALLLAEEATLNLEGITS